MDKGYDMAKGGANINLFFSTIYITAFKKNNYNNKTVQISKGVENQKGRDGNF